MRVLTTNKQSQLPIGRGQPDCTEAPPFWQAEINLNAVDSRPVVSGRLNFMKTSFGRLEYWLGGQGPAIVALHGAPGGYDQALAIYGKLLRTGCTLICPSRPGYLGTPLEKVYSPDEQAEMVAELLAGLSVKKAIVLGFSAGGMAAVKLAHKYPDLVCGLLLDSAVTRPLKTDAKLVSMFRLLANVFAEGLSTLLVDKVPSASVRTLLKIESNYNHSQLNETLQEIMSCPEKLSFAKAFVKSSLPSKSRLPGFLNDVRQMAEFNLGTSAITCPTLIIHGNNDGDVPVYHARYAASTIPKSRLSVFNNAFHVIGLSPGNNQSEADSLRLSFVLAQLQQR